MATVELLSFEDAPVTARKFYKDGSAGPITASLAHAPEILEVTLPFIGRVLGASSIDVRTKEIVILRTSAQLACTYCTQTHTVVALSTGLSRREVRALRGELDVREAFERGRDRALVAFTDAVAGSGPVPAATREALAEHCEDAEIMELTLLVGATMMLNRYCTALELPTAPAHLQRLAEEGL